MANESDMTGSPANRDNPAAVFLSYASEDAVAAQRICEALRAAGIEVWFDRSELRGGDAWDQAIRRQIKHCALFVPVISANTHARAEGYFRLEWKLGIDRSHLIAPDRPFLVPVAVDGTPQSDERIPDRFREVQWIRLPGGETSAGFVERVHRLLAPGAGPLLPSAAAPAQKEGVQRAPTVPVNVRRALPAWGWVAALATVGALGYFALQRTGPPGPLPEVPTPRAPSADAPAPKPMEASFSPPPHSVAVLPFVNMSGDKSQDYFSDGLSEELLNSLSRINDLQVAARTSSFSFKGKDVKIGSIGRELNVAAVLEGSVRRSGNTVRITAELVNSVTGFRLWSDTYDRNLGDVLRLQTDIANSVANALKVTLLGNESAKIELGGTRNPAALDAYLKALVAYNTVHDRKGIQAAIASFSDAVRLDPEFALAYAHRSFALAGYAQQYSQGIDDSNHSFALAMSDARRALELTPNLAEAHATLAQLIEDQNEIEKAVPEYRRALELAPNSTAVLRRYSIFAAQIGQNEQAVAAARRYVALDPLNAVSHRNLGDVLRYTGDQQGALAAYQQALAIDPEAPQSYFRRGASLYSLHRFEEARTTCEARPGDWEGQLCLAVTYDKLGRRADAQAQLSAMQKEQGDASAYQYAQIYAQWGEPGKALEWLETAQKLNDPGLQLLKCDPWMEPLRHEPRYRVIEKALKFPDLSAAGSRL